MKTNSQVNSTFKQRYRIIVFLAIFLNVLVRSAIATDYTAIASGSWNNPATWAVGGTTFPGANDNVTIGGTFTVTVNISNAACNNLTLEGTTGTRLSVGNYVFTINGTLSGPDATFSNSIITTGSGSLKFAGSVSRSLLGTWSPNTNTWACNITLGSTTTGTISTPVNFGNLTIAGGIVTLNADVSCNDLTLSGTSSRLTIGSSTISVNGKLSGPNATFTSDIITTGTGRLKFTGSSRALIGTWTSSNTYLGSWLCEIDLTDDTHTGTLTGNSKIGSLTITKGVLSIANLTLSLNGTLNGPSTSFTHNIITATTGVVKFTGPGTNRTLFGTWNSSYSIPWNCEIALSANAASGTNPTSINFNNLTISAGTFSLGANASCNNLSLSGTSGIRLALNDKILNVSGMLSGPTSLTVPIVSNSTNGKIRFIGNSRTLIGSWAAEYSPGFDCELALNSNQTVTSNYQINFNNLEITSGEFQVGTPTSAKSLIIDGGSQGTGSITISSGAKLVISGNLSQSSYNPTAYCGNVNIRGTLTFQGDFLNGNIIVNDGGTLEIKRINTSTPLLSFFIQDIKNFTYSTNSTLLYSVEGSATSMFTGAEVLQTTQDPSNTYPIGNIIVGQNNTITLNNTSPILVSCNNLSVSSNAALIVPPSFGLTAKGNTNLTGQLILKTSLDEFRPITGTFINNGSVSGNINMELYYSSNGNNIGGRGFYFSSPISNATSEIFTPSIGDNILTYQDETQRKYIKITTDDVPLTVSKGYILRSANSGLFTFTGTPNSNNSYPVGPIPRIDDKHYYLMGNPYPSVIDWDLIDTSNNISSTIWYRACDLSGAMVPADTYNGYLKVGTNNNGSAEVDGKIPPMQSVWVQCAADGNGSLTIPNSARSHSWGSASFIKSPAKKNKDVLRLSISSGTYRDESIIVQSDLAQNYFERGDSKKMILGNPKIAEMYTLSSEKYKLSIQSVKPISNADTILIGINVGTEGIYKFVADLSNIDHVNNIYLEDKLLNIKQNLFENPEYTFTSTVVSDTLGTRFALLFFPVPKIVTSVPAAVCSPETVDLTSLSVTNGSTSGLKFTYWTNAEATTQYTSPTVAGSGTYYIKGTDALGNYAISEPVIVTINPKPTVVTTNPAEVIEPATVDLTSPEITNGSTSGLIYSYWTDANTTIPYNTPTTATSGDYYIKGTIESTGCYSIGGPVSVIVKPNSTDITTDVGDELSVYTTNNQIHVLNSELNSIITVYDIIGCKHYSGTSKSNHEVISRNFKTGIYIVKIANGKNVKSKKIYIN